MDQVVQLDLFNDYDFYKSYSFNHIKIEPTGWEAGKNNILLLLERSSGGNILLLRNFFSGKLN